jgi:pilus assembly protein CpaC
MKRFMFLLAAAVLALGAQAPTRAHAAADVVAGAETELKLEAGKGKLIRLTRPAATVFIAEPKVADVQVKSPTLVYVVAKAPGSTSLFAIDKQEQMIANIAIKVGFDGDRLNSLIRSQAPGAEVQATTAANGLILTGKVSSASEGEDVLRIASLFVGGEGLKTDRIVNRLTIEAPNQVNLRVKIAEVSREATTQLGLNYSGSIGNVNILTGRAVPDATGPLTPVDRPFGVFSGSIGTLSAELDALERKQLITVLAEPNLTAVSGEPASFLAGGEFPIPVPQGERDITIMFKQFGVSLAFVATILDNGRISLNVRPEVSELSAAGSVIIRDITVPGLTTRRAETTVELGSGQSFAIAGLIQNHLTQDVRGLPKMADLPILGALFRSKRFQRNESELVIIVTPYLVKPTSRRLASPLDHDAVSGAAPAIASTSTPAPADPEKKG